MFVNGKIAGCGVSNAEYLSQEHEKGHPEYVLSRSDLVKIRQCPHKWRYGEAREETASMSWGSLVDRLVLGGEGDIAIVPDEYESADGKMKPWNWNANTCKAWREEQAGKITCDSDMYQKAKHAADLIREDEIIASVLNKARYQLMVTAQWQAKDVVVPVKVLIDIVPHATNTLADLKTASSLEHKEYVRSIYKYGYHVQAGLYLDVFNSAVGDKEKRDTFLHVAQESTPPYEVGRRMLSNDWLALGRAEYKKALDIYADCLKSGVWQSYDDFSSPACQRVEGFVMLAPEPWMILHAGVEVSNKPDWME